jgi:hypothetical protein
VYVYDGFVRAECRRLGVWSQLHASLLDRMVRLDGRRFLVSAVDYINWRSTSAHYRLGCLHFQELFTLMCFGRAFNVCMSTRNAASDRADGFLRAWQCR